MERPKHIALFLQIRSYWSRAIAQGVFRVTRSVTAWQPFLLQQLPGLDAVASPGSPIRGWAAVIGQFYEEHHELLRRFHQLGLQTVNVSSCPPPATTIWVHNDDEACGAMAARFFVERGYRHFAFMGIPSAVFAAQRLKGFTDELKRLQSGLPMDLTPGRGKKDSDIRITAAKLRQLPLPCAIFGCNDQRAKHCLSAALEAGFKVPEELAILGVDNDDIFCEMSPIALSSIRPDWNRVGTCAVESLLERPGNEPPAVHRRILPMELVQRRSTDASAIEDELAAAALKIIWNSIDNGIDPDRVAAALSVSRRTLERRLQRATGNSARLAILDARMRRAYQRVVNTQLPFGEIASLCGFSKQSQFNAAFKSRFHATPGEVRKGGHGP